MLRNKWEQGTNGWKMKDFEGFILCRGEVPFYRVSLAKYLGRNEAEVSRYCKSSKLSEGIGSKTCSKLMLQLPQSPADAPATFLGHTQNPAGHRAVPSSG